MAASDAGEETAWTKINGSSVHAHTDTYLCIVARSHSWIHINCAVRFHRTAEDPYRKRWRGLRVIVLRIPLRGSKVSRSRKLRDSFVIYFRRLFAFFFLRMCHGRTSMAAHRSAIWENMRLATKINFGDAHNSFSIWKYRGHRGLRISSVKRERDGRGIFRLYSFNKTVVVKDTARGERKPRLLEIFDCHSPQAFLASFQTSYSRHKRVPCIPSCYIMIFMVWARGLVSLVCFRSTQLYLVSTWRFNPWYQPSFSGISQ